MTMSSVHITPIHIVNFLVLEPSSLTGNSPDLRNCANRITESYPLHLITSSACQFVNTEGLQKEGIIIQLQVDAKEVQVLAEFIELAYRWLSQEFTVYGVSNPDGKRYSVWAM